MQVVAACAESAPVPCGRRCGPAGAGCDAIDEGAVGLL
jgi:hypothetical protein